MNFIAPRHLEITLNWKTVTSSVGDPDWCFGEVLGIGEGLKKKIQGPQIYRFLFHPRNSAPDELPGMTGVYVGQSEHFEKRCAQYIRGLKKSSGASAHNAESNAKSLGEAWKEMQRNPCVRIASRLKNAEIDKARVELQLLDFAEFWINRIEISYEVMGNVFVRHLVENLAILDSDRPGFYLMNAGRALEAERFGQLLERIGGRGQACPMTEANMESR